MTKENLYTIYEIKERRKKLGLTQKKLAEMCNVSLPTIKRLESNNYKFRPSFRTMQNVTYILFNSFQIEVN